MSCTKHFLNFHWEHHHWRPRVTLAEDVATQETDMWGRHFNTHYVRCHKHEVCAVCGKTRREIPCMCDTSEGQHCAIRLAWLDESQKPAAG